MFRHSYASYMAEKTTAEKVAKVLGDSRETVFKNYFSLTEKDKDDIVEASESIYEDNDWNKIKFIVKGEISEMKNSSFYFRFYVLRWER